MAETSAYDALNFDGTECRDKYRLIGFRGDILQIVEGNLPAAILYNIIDRWQTLFKWPEVMQKIRARQASGQPPYTQEEVEDMMFVYMSYNDFVREALGAHSYNTVIRAIDYLVERHIVFQREYHGLEAKFKYSINRKLVRQLLKELPDFPFVPFKLPKKGVDSTQIGRLADLSENGTLVYPNRYRTLPKLVDHSTQIGRASTQIGRQHNKHTDNTQRHTESHFDKDLSANADILSSPAFEVSLVVEEPCKTVKPTAPPKSEATLEGDALRFYKEIWCHLPWYKDCKPKITPTLTEHMKTLAGFQPWPTVEEIVAARNFDWDTHPKHKGKAWYPGHLINIWPAFRSATYEAQITPPPPQLKGYQNSDTPAEIPVLRSRYVPAAERRKREKEEQCLPTRGVRHDDG